VSESVFLCAEVGVCVCVCVCDPPGDNYSSGCSITSYLHKQTNPSVSALCLICSEIPAGVVSLD